MTLSFLSQWDDMLGNQLTWPLQYINPVCPELIFVSELELFPCKYLFISSPFLDMENLY